MELLKKISMARKAIKESDLKKAGKNTHSKYDYYTPEQVNHLVNDACNKLLLLNTYELVRTELGLVAQVTVWDLGGEESKVFSMATEIPSITSTNIAQQLGGAVTYSERYLLMSIYDIKDNNLDFDTDKKPEKKADSKSNQTNFEARTITQPEVEKWNGKIYGGNAVYINNVKVIPPADQIERLKKHPNYKPDEKK